MAGADKETHTSCTSCACHVGLYVAEIAVKLSAAE